MKYKNIRRLILSGLVLMLLLSITGCGVPDELIHPIQQALQFRADANIQFLSSMYTAGLISETTKNEVEKEITKHIADAVEGFKDAMSGNNDSDKAKAAFQSVTGWSVVHATQHYSKGVAIHDSGELCGRGVCKVDDMCDFEREAALTNYMGANYADTVLKSNIPAVSGGTVKPIELISASSMALINNDLAKVRVYILRDDIANVPLTTISSALATKDASVLDRYFKDSGRGVLNPNEDAREQMVVVTGKDVNSIRKGTASTYVSGCGETGVLYACGGNVYNTLSNGTDQLGTDLTIITGTGQPYLNIRLIEFNSTALNTFIDRLNAENTIYVPVMVDGKPRVYLVEYPIAFAVRFNEIDATTFEPVFIKSQLYYNIKTQSFKKTEVNGKDKTEISKDATYLNDKSVVLFNVKTPDGSINGDSWKASVGFGVGAKEMNVGRLVLRDYLELTYAPGIVEGESVVALGRKLRLTQFSSTSELEFSNTNKLAWSKAKPVASVVDTSTGELLKKDGYTVDLYIQDFADRDALTVQGSETVKYIPENGISAREIVIDSDDAVNTENAVENKEDKKDTTLKDKANAIITLPTQITPEIVVSRPFPYKSSNTHTQWKNIAGTDENIKDTKPLMYGITVRKSIFESGLFSDWIMSSDSKGNSLAWWNQWLYNNKFSYRINDNSLTSYLKGNYATQLSEEGVVMLDLKVISQIREIYEEEDKIETSQTIKSIFNVIGYLLISYAVILLVAWNVDVNVDIGLGLVQKMTFGNWIAVKDKSEMPILHRYDNSDGTKYVDFKELALSCAGIVLLGILLVFLNVTQLVLWLIGLFGGIADAISGLVTGGR